MIQFASTIQFASMTEDSLGDEIARLSAHIHAATYQLLVLIREFDAREGWANGFRSCADWLSWRTGVAPGAAREKVRVARALAELPLISEKMREGSLSFSKARAITRVATPENEADLADLADHTTAAHIEKIVRAWRRVDRLEDAEQEAARHDGRNLTLYQDDDGMFVVTGRLDPEVGGLLEKAMEAAEAHLYRSGKTAETDEPRAGERAMEEHPTAEQRRADAIGFLAEQALAHSESAGTRPPRRADRFQVILHMNREANSGPAHDTIDVSAETSRRLACDAGLVVMTHDVDENVLDVGRKRRTVPPALRRALESRDQGCRFPGCGLKHTDAHHIAHWSEGGHTRLDNLVLLCRRHHRAVHEDGWTVQLDDSRSKTDRMKFLRMKFLRPDGRWLPAVPRCSEVPSNPAAALGRANRLRGIRPSSWTTTPDWGGERLDLGLAIDMLRPTISLSPDGPS